MEVRTLVTGGSGFVGINLVTALQRAGRVVLSLGTRATTPHGQQDVYSRVDILNAGAVMAAVDAFRPHEVVHLAARTDFAGRDDFYGYTVNTLGARNVVAAIAKTPGIERALFASSLVVNASWDNNEYGYAKSKAAMEAIVSGSGLDAGGCAWALLRLGHVWGPWMGSPYCAFFQAIARGRYFNLGNVDTPKCLVYVGNAVHQIDQLLRAPPAQVQGRLFYVAEKQPICIGEWARLVAAALGRRPPRHVPEPAVRFAARCGDALALLGWNNPPLSSRRLSNMRTPSPSIPIDETLELVGTLPFTTVQGVEATLQWLRHERLIK